LNPLYLRRLEAVISRLARSGLRVELLLFNYYSLPFVDPDQWTRPRENRWLRELVARFSANPAVFLWTVTNEYETYPDGRYRYDGQSDDEWVRRIARSIHALDARHHPVTVHNFTFDDDRWTC
jgi:hypothetical protein